MYRSRKASGWEPEPLGMVEKWLAWRSLFGLDFGEGFGTERRTPTVRGRHKNKPPKNESGEERRGGWFETKKEEEGGELVHIAIGEPAGGTPQARWGGSSERTSQRPERSSEL